MVKSSLFGGCLAALGLLLGGGAILSGGCKARTFNPSDDVEDGAVTAAVLDAQNGYRRVCVEGSVQLRAEPRADAEVKATLTESSVVKLLQGRSNEFIEVDFFGTRGWVVNVVQGKSSLCYTTFSMRRTCPNAGTTNLLYAPAKDGGVARTIPANTPLRFYEYVSENEKDGTAYIFARVGDGPFGWVDAKKICNVEDKREICKTEATDMYSDKSFRSSKVAHLVKGDRFEISEIANDSAGNGWVKASFKGKTGWIFTEYVCYPGARKNWAVPLRNSPCVTSPFDPNRMHPVLGYVRPHTGTDLSAQYVPVFAAGDGRVLSAGWAGGYGNLLEIEHSGGWVTRYAHLEQFTVTSGTVKQGQQVAVSGATGLGSGPHLHFEMLRNNEHTDPEQVLRQVDIRIPHCQ